MKTGERIEIGAVKLEFMVAQEIVVYLVSNKGTLSDPKSKLIIEVYCCNHTFSKESHRGRKSHRTMYFNQETEEFTRRPYGKKGWGDEYANKAEIVAFIKESITSIGG